MVVPALTSYLCHSLITGVIFDYIGCYDRWQRPALPCLALAIFALQLWVSPIWLRVW